MFLVGDIFLVGDPGGRLRIPISATTSPTASAARTRHPIPGETRMPDGRPAWPPAALQAWRTNTGNTGTTDHPS
jgi:hypothetical protein